MRLYFYRRRLFINAILYQRWLRMSFKLHSEKSSVVKILHSIWKCKTSWPGYCCTHNGTVPTVSRLDCRPLLCWLDEAIHEEFLLTRWNNSQMLWMAVPQQPTQLEDSLTWHLGLLKQSAAQPTIAELIWWQCWEWAWDDWAGHWWLVRSVNAAASLVLHASHRCAHQQLSLDPQTEPA